MKFSLDKETFENALAPISVIAQSKASDSKLSGIYLETVGNELTLYCYDMEKGIKITVDANVESEGSVVADTQIVQIVHAMPQGDVTVDVNENLIVTLSCCDAEFQLSGKDGSDYPKIPELKGHTPFVLQKKQLKNVISKTMFAICRDDSKPVLKGSFFEIKDNILTVSAIDGFRIAVRKEKSAADNTDVDISFIIPGRVQQSLLRILNDGDDDIQMELGSKHIIMKIDEMHFVIRLIEGEFPKYERYIPQYSTTSIVDRNALIDSLERIAIVNDKLKGSAKLSFKERMLRLSCQTDEGKVNDMLPVVTEGSDIDVLYNQNYLLEALRACDNDSVYLRIAEGGRGTVICATPHDAKENEDSEYLYLVMPIRSRG